METKIEASADGGSTWTVVEEYGATNDWGAKLFDITSIVGTSATAHVKFTYAGDYAYYYAVDNIAVQVPTVSAPDAVTNLMPADGAVDVPIMLNEAGDTKMIGFTFDAPTTGEAADRYDWYFDRSMYFGNMFTPSLNLLLLVTNLPGSVRFNFSNQSGIHYDIFLLTI